MVKRISLVWKRADVSKADFRELWLGAHAEVATQLPGLRGYSIDFVTEAPPGAPDGLATILFETREALDAAFALPSLKTDLLRTREAFAERVQVLFVDEVVVIGDERKQPQ